MSFASWCLYRADCTRRRLAALMMSLERTRITREHEADAARNYTIVERRTCGHSARKPGLDELDGEFA